MLKQAPPKAQAMPSSFSGRHRSFCRRKVISGNNEDNYFAASLGADALYGLLTPNDLSPMARSGQDFPFPPV
jgi:hypothetical protein